VPEQVHVTEVALRDGLQIEPVVVPTDRKLELARGFVQAGITQLEVGAFVHPRLVPTMADTADVVAGVRELPAMAHALVLNEQGARRAVAAGAQSVRLVTSASEGHSRSNAGVGTEEAMDRIRAAAAILSAAGIRMEGCVATAFACPFDGDTPVERVVRVVQNYVRIGVEVVHLSDTIGAASPGDVRRAVTAVRDLVSEQALSLHLHDTYGMSAACVWEGLQLGVRRFDAALGGLGGCPFAPGATGNIATDDLVHLLHREGFETGIDPSALVELRDELATVVGHPLDSSLARASARPQVRRLLPV
jgi:hydroxymethylglutaryl-CoA lyase